MSEQVGIAIFGAVTLFLTHAILFALGRRSEKKKQSLIVRSKMLEPIDN